MKRIALSILAIIALAIVLLSFSATRVQAACTVTPKTVTLYADQTIDAGTVTVTNDAANLYVTVTTTGPWLLSQTQLHISDNSPVCWLGAFGPQQAG